MTKKKLECFTKKDNAKKPYVYCIDGTTKKKPKTIIIKRKKKKPRTIIIKRKKKRVVKGDGNILKKIKGVRSLSQPTIKPVVASIRSLSKTGDGNILPKIRGFRSLSQPTIKPVVSSFRSLSKPKNIEGDGNILPKIRGFRKLSQSTIKPVVASLKNTADWGDDYQRPHVDYQDGWHETNQFWQNMDNAFDEWMAQDESDSENEFLYQQHPNYSPRQRRKEEQSVMDDTDGNKEKPRSMAERTRVVAKMKEAVRKKGDVFFTWLDRNPTELYSRMVDGQRVKSVHPLVRKAIPTYSSPAMTERFKKNYDRLNPYGELLSLKWDGSKKQGLPYPIGESLEANRIRHNKAVEGAMEAVGADPTGREERVPELARKAIPTYSSPAMTKRFKKNYDRLNPYGKLLSLKRDGSKKQGYPYPIGESRESKIIRHNKAVEGATEAVDNFKRKAGSGGANKKPEGTNAQDRRDRESRERRRYYGGGVG